MNQAIALAIAEEMERDDRVVIFGEDIAQAEGPFKTSEGLLARFGPGRVRDTPISEMGFVGCAVGAAVTGLRPIVEIMFIEFLGVALDQLVTEAATMHFLSGGKLRAPLTLRASVGAGLGFGCQHSQTLERWLLGTPGLKVAVASGARTAYGLTKAAIRDDDPVVVLEPRSLYGRREDFEPNEQAIAVLGQGEVVKKGSDVTVVALGQTVASAPGGGRVVWMVWRGHRSAHDPALGQGHRDRFGGKDRKACHCRRKSVHRRMGKRHRVIRCLSKLWRPQCTAAQGDCARRPRPLRHGARAALPAGA